MLSSKITIPAPKIKDREVKKPLLCGPGPCDFWPSVAEALTRPTVSPFCDEYYNIIDDIRAGLKYLFQTQSNLVLAISGSGPSGMETVICNLVGPKETMLIASRGTWDERAFNMAMRYGINAVQLRIPFNTTFSLAQIETELQKLKPTALFITHGDSSTGTVQNLEGLGNICHKMLSSKITIPAPKIKDREVKKPLLCGPGPCDFWPSVAEALTRPTVSPFCDEYYNIIDDIRAGLKYLFQTQSNLVLAISGSGPSGMETVICNLVGPKETMLIASRGTWDERAFNMAMRYGINAVQLRIPFNTTFSLAQIETELQKLKPTALFITHGDSSTGTVQNLEGLGNICHKYGTLLIVDTVVSIGGVPFFMDEWGVDAVYASTQKALGGPAGISPVAFSARAEEKLNSRKHQPPFYFDMKLLALQWNCYGNTRAYHHTMCAPLMWVLRCCLQEICNRTLPILWEQHKTATVHFHKRLEEYGFKLLVPKVEDRLPTATTVVIPKGYDHAEFCKYIRDTHNILIYVGYGPTVGKALRIGIMGVNATKSVDDAIADAMADGLKALKKSPM